MLERAAPFQGVAIDLGTGDGAWPYRQASTHPERLFIGLDANAEGLADVSRKAARKPARGGRSNVLFGCAQAEALPETLDGLASELTVLFPWASLLTAVARGDPRVLAGLRRVCQPGAELRVVYAYSQIAEADLVDALALSAPPPEAAYRAAGFTRLVGRTLRLEEARALGSTWAGKLAHGRPRTFVELTARAA